MTDPLQSYDLELLKRYGAEVQELETLPPVAIELTAEQALALVTHIQISAANPAVQHNPLLPSAIAAAKQIQSTSFKPESAINKVLELGWDENQKKTGQYVPSQILTSASSRKKRLHSPDKYRRPPDFLL
jgi:hypothetical protein